MDIDINSYYKKWIDSSDKIDSIILCFEYLNQNLLNTILNYIDINSISKISILIKDISICHLNNLSYINSLQILKNTNIDIKVNNKLDFTGFLINNTNLLILNYNYSYDIVKAKLTESYEEIESYTNAFKSLNNSSISLNHIYDEILNRYIEKSLNIENIVLNYVNFFKSNNYLDKNSYLFDQTIEIESYDVPQFSNFENAVYKLPNLLNINNIGFSFSEIGKLLLSEGKLNGAYLKYGENHSKTAELLGLTYINNNSKNKLVFLSDLGKRYLKLSENDKTIFLMHQIYNLTLIKSIFNTCFYKKIDITEYILEISNLKESTAKRRSSNVKNLINFISDDTSSNIFKNCFPTKSKSVVNKVEKDYIIKTIENKIGSTKFLHIDALNKYIKLHNIDLLKKNNISNSLDLYNFISKNLKIKNYNFNYPLIISNDLKTNNPFDYLSDNTKIINRDIFIDSFVKMGFSLKAAKNEVDKNLLNLIRIDYENYVRIDSFSIDNTDLNNIKEYFKNSIVKNGFISLLDPFIEMNLPDINYEYNLYILHSIVRHYLKNEFKVIYKFSNTTYKYKYLFLVNDNSKINSFTELLIEIINKIYPGLDSIKFTDIENYLILNNILQNSLCKTFIDDTLIQIDELNRLSII